MSNSNYAISLSGLQNTAKAIDTVSNNIANANTVGYKAGEYVFADQFLKSVNAVDFARVGMGTQTLGVRRPNVQGTIVNSANPLDLAISGKGMFRLLAGTPTVASNYPPTPGTSANNRPAVDPAAIYYTRNGQFGVDKDGYIVNENGMYLTGFQPTADGTGITDSFLMNYGLLKMPPANLPGRETTSSKISTILDSTGSAFTKTANVEFDPSQNTYNNKTTQTVFDYEGNRRTLELYYRRITDTALDITYNGSTLTYQPSASSEPGVAGTTNIEINKMSVMRVDTAPVHANKAASAVVSGTSLTLSSTPPVSLADHRLYVNGVDTGVKVNSVTGSTLTLSDPVNIPSGAAVSFYPPYVYQANSITAGPPVVNNGDIGAVAAGSTTTLTMLNTPPSINTIKGYRVFVDGIDTGANVDSIVGNVVTLSRPFVNPTLITAGKEVEYRPVLDFTVITPDGTNLTVQGTTNDLALNDSDGVGTEGVTTKSWKFVAVASNVEVYASIDGRFYDKDATSTSNRPGITQEVQPNTLNYKPVSKLMFVGGKNIDSLIKDSMSGDPLFTTTTTLSTKVSGVGTGVTDLVFKLDLTDTSLLPGAFQVLSSVQNGEPLARLSNVTIDNGGRIVGVYGSGKQIYVGQVVLADFTAFEELIPVGKNAFAPSAASGTEASAYGVVLGRAGTGPFGEIKSQALESSNVDLANELVRLMIMQRSYTANSQGLRAVDSTLRDMLDIMR